MRQISEMIDNNIDENSKVCKDQKAHIKSVYSSQTEFDTCYNCFAQEACAKASRKAWLTAVKEFAERDGCTLT